MYIFWAVYLAFCIIAVLCMFFGLIWTSRWFAKIRFKLQQPKVDYFLEEIQRIRKETKYLHPTVDDEDFNEVLRKVEAYHLKLKRYDTTSVKEKKRQRALRDMELLAKKMSRYRRRQLGR